MKWLALHGVVEINGADLKFIGENRGRTKRQPAVDIISNTETFAIARSDISFESGVITAKVFIERSGSKVQFRFSPDSLRTIYAGINVAEHPYGISASEASEAKTIAVSGLGSQPPTGRWFSLEVRVTGSTVEVYIDSVRTAFGQANIARSQLEILLQGQGRVEVKDVDVKTSKPTAFVVMQFTQEYTALYKEVIQPVCIEYGYEVVRGDDVYTNTQILEDINRQIQLSSVIIADITPNNPNVYYEVGYAHALGKPTILLSDRSREKLPFDVSGFRVLFYDNTIGGKSVVEGTLRKHLSAMRA